MQNIYCSDVLRYVLWRSILFLLYSQFQQDRTRVTFEQGDACALRSDLGAFDVILAANLVCRLHHPKYFLDRLRQLLPKPGSILVLTGPYTWLQQWTDKVGSAVFCYFDLLFHCIPTGEHGSSVGRARESW